MSLNKHRELCNEVYNDIGKYAFDKGYIPYAFTEQMPRSKNLVLEDIENIEIIYVDVHYLHVRDTEGGLVLSIYYDENGFTSPFYDNPVFEVYDGGDVERFSTDEADMKCMKKLCKSIIDKRASKEMEGEPND